MFCGVGEVDWERAGDCEKQGGETYLRGDIFKGVGVSDLVTERDIFLCAVEDRSECRYTSTSPG